MRALLAQLVLSSEAQARVQVAATRLVVAFLHQYGLSTKEGGMLICITQALRLYAAQAEADLAAPTELPGPTGERNEPRSPPRGLVACLATADSGVAALAAERWRTRAKKARAGSASLFLGQWLERRGYQSTE